MKLVRKLFAVSTLIVCLVPCAFAQKWRMVVTGDDRWNTNSPRTGLDQDGVNVTGMTELNKAIIQEKPDVLLFSGDTVGGANTDEEETS